MLALLALLTPYARPWAQRIGLISPAFSIVSSPSSGLSESDKVVYAAILTAQRQGHFADAESLEPQLNAPILMGHVLAQRYLDPRNRTKKEEILQWFQNYSDHPEAPRMEALAKRLHVLLDPLTRLLIPRETLQGNGRVFHLGRSSLPDPWYHALTLWKEGRFAEAEASFAAVGQAAEHPWHRSAAFYWQARAAEKQGKAKESRALLSHASQAPTSFYGLLARAKLGHRVTLPIAVPPVSDALRERPAIARATAFVALDRMEEAERELRILYPQLLPSDQLALMTISAELGLANLQVLIGQNHPEAKQHELFATYPMPERMRTAQSIVPASLVLAIARQESGFRVDANSSGGAVGMMQMLPSTASHVMRQSDPLALGLAQILSDPTDAAPEPITQRLQDDRLSIRLGALYLELLTQEPSIGRNLIRILAGYNAGPGTVANWQRSGAKNITDPLLYLESIPYAETHNYVMQVLANQWIYEIMMGNSPDSLDRLTHDRWPILPPSPTVALEKSGDAKDLSMVKTGKRG